MSIRTINLFCKLRMIYSAFDLIGLDFILSFKQTYFIIFLQICTNFFSESISKSCCKFWIYWVGVNTRYSTCHFVNFVFTPTQLIQKLRHNIKRIWSLRIVFLLNKKIHFKSILTTRLNLFETIKNLC